MQIRAASVMEQANDETRIALERTRRVPAHRPHNQQLMPVKNNSQPGVRDDLPRVSTNGSDYQTNADSHSLVGTGPLKKAGSKLVGQQKILSHK